MPRRAERHGGADPRSRCPEGLERACPGSPAPPGPRWPPGRQCRRPRPRQPNPRRRSPAGRWQGPPAFAAFRPPSGAAARRRSRRRRRSPPASRSSSAAIRKSLLACAKPRLTDTSGSYLPGGRPPVPPAVGSAGPDRKDRDFIRPARATEGVAIMILPLTWPPGGTTPRAPPRRSPWPAPRTLPRTRRWRRIWSGRRP